MDHPSTDDPLAEAIDAGSEISGKRRRSRIGTLGCWSTGALGGAAAGPIIARALSWMAGEVRERVTGPREDARIGAVLAYSVLAINDRIEQGEKPRDDGSWDDEETDRSTAKELAEGVVLSAQREYEERKLPFLGRLHASFVFDSSIDRSQANLLLRLFNDLSFQQLVLMQAIGGGHLPQRGDYRGQGHFTFELITLLSDAKSLYDQGLFSFGKPDTMLGPTDFNPGLAQLQGMGTKLYTLAGLGSDVDESELARIIRLLG